MAPGLVGADDEFGKEFVGEAVKIAAVELGVGTGLEVGFYHTVRLRARCNWGKTNYHAW